MIPRADTKIETEGRPRRRYRGLTPFPFTLALLGLAPSVAAEEPRRPPPRDDRVVAIRSQADQPVAVYWTPEVPLQLVFDAPLARNIPRLSGVEVTPHPVLANALVIVASKALASRRGAVPLTVPLVTGPVAVSLVSRPAASDRRVRIVHVEPRGIDRPAVSWARRPLVEVTVTRASEPFGSGCRLEVLVRTSLEPEAHILEARSQDPLFCEARFR